MFLHSATVMVLRLCSKSSGIPHIPFFKNRRVSQAFVSAKTAAFPLTNSFPPELDIVNRRFPTSVIYKNVTPC
jgi:hypothetical protein